MLHFVDENLAQLLVFGLCLGVRNTQVIVAMLGTAEAYAAKDPLPADSAAALEF